MTAPETRHIAPDVMRIMLGLLAERLTAAPDDARAFAAEEGEPDTYAHHRAAYLQVEVMRAARVLRRLCAQMETT